VSAVLINKAKRGSIGIKIDIRGRIFLNQNVCVASTFIYDFSLNSIRALSL
jgi:hypothetical protein